MHLAVSGEVNGVKSDDVPEGSAEWKIVHGHRPSLKNLEVAKVSFDLHASDSGKVSDPISPSQFTILESVNEENELEELEEGEVESEEEPQLPKGKGAGLEVVFAGKTGTKASNKDVKGTLPLGSYY
ncbi:hypothetical protein Bca4012_083260 [Brassica carinata]|uniref:Uncharacterized protein n=1 Tax=Brassica carinata TaxID=52824 RepID=A0A8X8ANA1_BRACI|nr:hypothetical protein Bca52824_027511 [Brassica carinata]